MMLFHQAERACVWNGVFFSFRNRTRPDSPESLIFPLTIATQIDYY